jgi:hypothetical protein
MADYAKKIKRLLRECVTEAYERELYRELTKLDQSFAEWRNGTIGSGELSHRIHAYENGPSRALFNRYNQGEDDLNVAYAIVAGILDRDQIPAELLEAIGRPLDFFQSMKERNELREPGT